MFEIAQSATRKPHLSFFLSPTTMLAHLLQLIFGFVLTILACHRHSQSLLACFAFSLLGKCSPNKSTTNIRLCYLQCEVWRGLFQPVLCWTAPKCGFPNLVHRILALQIMAPTVSADSLKIFTSLLIVGQYCIFQHGLLPRNDAWLQWITVPTTAKRGFPNFVHKILASLLIVWQHWVIYLYQHQLSQWLVYIIIFSC